MQLKISIGEFELAEELIRQVGSDDWSCCLRSWGLMYNRKC